MFQKYPSAACTTQPPPHDVVSLWYFVGFQRKILGALCLLLDFPMAHYAVVVFSPPFTQATHCCAPSQQLKRILFVVQQVNKVFSSVNLCSKHGPLSSRETYKTIQQG